MTQWGWPIHGAKSHFKSWHVSQTFMKLTSSVLNLVDWNNAINCYSTNELIRVRTSCLRINQRNWVLQIYLEHYFTKMSNFSYCNVKPFSQESVW